MAVATSLSLSKLHLLPKQKQTQLTLSTQAPNFLFFSRKRAQFPAPIISIPSQNLKYNAAIVLGVTGLAFTVLNVGPASGSELALMGSSFQFNEPSNALSLHTWASHVSSVVEWVTAMALVWQYGEKSGYESWKGLSWAMSNYHSLMILIISHQSISSIPPIPNLAEDSSVLIDSWMTL
uniref:Uncharacterized protein isoform X2 n=1 Tax=Nicotiana tabacum TaxID=4097 RepID=A0A1S4A527_TOBAC|nr:PREDICTED: uncharacterized protein LOC107793784 isoform X2 [Nicotiana tabacum]